MSGSALDAAIRGADEGYLTALANKGLYKRALRELPEAGIRLEREGETLAALFADGTRVELADSIQSYRCSCPSRSVCKHLLMAVLAAQQGMEAGGESAPEAEGNLPPDFSPLLEATPEGLRRLAGKKVLAAAVFAVQIHGGGAEVQEGSTLAVTLADSGHTVRFLPGAPLEDSRCTCKSHRFCAHRTQAVLHYLVHRLGALPGPFVPQPEELEVEFGTLTLPHIREFVQGVLRTGLVRLPRDTAGRFLQLATICHGQRLANLERLYNRAAGQLERYEARSAAFQRDRLLADLCEMLDLCDALEGGSRDPRAVGVFREQYSPIPPVTLLGLGCWGWRSTGGYVGVSTIFYCPELSRTLTHTHALPADQNPDPERMARSGAPWKLPTKLSAISHAVLTLRGGKVSGRGQLSSTGDAVAQVQGKTDPFCQELAPVRFDDFAGLLEAVWRQEESGDPVLTALVIPARYGACRFDRVSQTLTLPIYDSAERRLLVRVRYEAATRLLMENLTHLEEENRLTGPLTARVSLEGGRLTAYPLAFPGMEPGNLSLDREQRTEKKKSRFDWGDL